MLIVDSSQELARPAELALRNAGARVRVATPRNLTRAVEECHPDVIVLDLKLAGVGGVAVADYLRRTPAARTCPIAFIARSATQLEREAASDYGPVIDEPIDPSAFCALVRDLFNEHRDALASNTVRFGGPKLLYA